MNSIRSNAHARDFARQRRAILTALIVSILSIELLATGCANIDTPNTSVVLDNKYASAAASPLVVFQAFWQVVAFTTPVPPGSSSTAQSTLPASDNTAWVVVAPGWDPASASPPSSFIVLQSRSGFGVHLDNTLHISVDDTNFAGNCASGSTLTQSQADFITQIVFPSIFHGRRYDAATCTTTQGDDAGAE